MNAKQTSKGFTIIEVVLVLAIAGLIFLMVFIALPALQAGQRDTARKNDVGVVASAVTSYTSNNKGTFPTTATIAGYTKAISSNTTAVTVGTAGATSVAVTQGQVKIVQKTTCSTTGAATNGSATQTLATGTANQFTVTTYIEASGGSSFCQDS